MELQYIVGVMSGSSLDGVDVCLCSFHDTGKWELLKSKVYDFPASLANALRNVPFHDVRLMHQLEVSFTDFCGQTVLQFLEDIRDIKIAAIATHGHTILHQPGYSIQLTNGARLATTVGLPVICDFRQGDIALGGQGTPLAATVDQQLFGEYAYALNLGGIANISIQMDVTKQAYDVVPCNQILNALSSELSKPFDYGGQIASTGKCNTTLLSSLSELDYFHKSVPKSLDNTWVMGPFYDIIKKNGSSISDKLSTMIHLIVDQIILAIKANQIPHQARMLVTGGGAFNTFLIEQLRIELVKIAVDLELPSPEIIDFKESILMAYLGYLRLQHKPNIVHQATGAERAHSGGAIYIP